jgi:hypothetical protein
MTWLWFTPLLALVVTWVLGRYNAGPIERDWEMMLTAKGRGADRSARAAGPVRWSGGRERPHRRAQRT